MLDRSDPRNKKAQNQGPALDFQEHLAALEAQGLVVRVDRPIDKDTELHPLVRWQFQGNLPEDERRAFLFTNVVDGSGKKYDMPVVVGALSASPRIYAIGMGKPLNEIGPAWINAINHPIAPVRVNSAPCQEVVIKGEELKKPDGGLKLLPVPISTPGFDAAPYLTATLCITKDPETGIQNMGTYRGALKATDRLGVRMASRIGGAGGYQHWLKHRKMKTPMPCAIVIGCAPVVVFTGPQKLAIDQDEMGVAGALAGEPIRTVKCVTIDLDVPADSEIVIEGLIDPELLEPEGPFGESHGYIALEDFNMSMQVTAITHKKKPVFVSIISQVTPSESSVIKKVAYEPMFLSHLRDQLSIKGIRNVSLLEPLANVRPVIFLLYAPGAARTEVWRGLHGASTFRADCGKIVIAVGEDIDPTNTNAVFWSMAYRANPIEARADRALSLQRPRSEVRAGPQRFIAADRRNAQTAVSAARPADKGIHGARAQDLGRDRHAANRAAAALARLHAGRLGRRLGNLRATRRRRRLGKERQGNLCAAAGRTDAGNTRARCRAQE